MKKYMFVFLMVFAPLSLVSCTGISDEELAATLVAQVESDVSLTLEAIPTSTPYATAVPQETAAAHPTIAPYNTATPYATQEPYPTATAYPTIAISVTATSEVVEVEPVEPETEPVTSESTTATAVGIDVSTELLQFAQATNQNMLLVAGAATRIDLNTAGSSLQECPEILALNTLITSPFPHDLSDEPQRIKELHTRFQQGVDTYVDGSKELVQYCRERVEQGVDEPIGRHFAWVVISMVKSAQTHLEFVIKALGGF